MAKRGNPGYSDEEKDEIISHVLVQVACGRFVSRIFREDATTPNGIKMPHVDTFWYWCLMDDSGELDRKVADARARGIEALLDQTVDIADDATLDLRIVKRHGEEFEEVDREHITRSRLRIDTRIKLAQMMKPKTYGPKLDLTSGGEQLGVADALEAARRRELKRLDAKGDK